MSVAQQMKTVVTLGGAVSPSFKSVGSMMGKTVTDAKVAVRSLDSEQSKMFKTLKRSRQAVTDLGEMTEAYRDQEVALSTLEAKRTTLNATLKAQRRELKGLERERAAAQEEGRDVSEVTAKHEALTAEIEKQVVARDGLNKEIFSTRSAQNKLNREMKRLKERTKDIGKLENEYRDLGNEAERAARKAHAWEKVGDIMGRARKRMRQVVAAGGAMVGMSTMLGGLVTMTGRATAEQLGLAKSYGMSIEAYKAWGGVAAEAGLDAENTGDLVEELTNKVGEFKALGKHSAVADVFGSLGLSASMLDGMDAADQFEFIMKRLEGVTDDQQAASLADMLMGGEGNKVVTYLRQSGKSLDDLLDTHRQFNQLTSAGAEGASEYSRSLSHLFGAASTSWEEISGIVGGELAPDINMLAATVSAFARENKEELVATLKEGVIFARDFFHGLWDVGSAIGSVVGGVADMVGGMDNLVRIGGILMAGFIGAKMIVGLVSMGSAIGGLVTVAGGLSAALPAVALGIKAVTAALMSNPLGLAAMGLITGGMAAYSYFSDDEDEESPELKSARNTVNSAVPASRGVVNQRVDKIEINAAPGQSPQEIGRAVATQLGGYQDDALYDIPMG